MEYIILIIGFVLLIKGADFFVEGSSSVAKQLRVPSMIIGLTIVAMGTSLPECSVSITAALAHKNGLAISNAVGSNTFNLMVVCGACTLFCPLAVQKETLKKEFPFSIVAALLLLGFGFTGMLVGHMEGFVMLFLFACFLIWMIQSARKARATASDEEEYEILPVWKCFLFIVGGIIAIKFGGDMVVDSASTIAKNFGMTDTLIGLTIVAFGTSLPELVTSIVAARKDEVDMALGNVIGSNIFNIFLILGLSATVNSLIINFATLIDMLVMLAAGLLVYGFILKDQKVTRQRGIILLVFYFSYVCYLLVR